MDLIIAANSVPLAQADVAPPTGTPQYATSGNPGASPVVPPTQIPAYHANMVASELLNIVKAAGLTPDGTNWGQVLEALGILFGGQLAPPTAYVSSGSITTAPIGTKWWRALICGGGGAGGGAQAVTGTNTSVGAGGGSGAWAEIWIPWTGAAIPFTLGAAGIANAGASGGNGGASSLAGFTIPGGMGGGVGAIGNAPNGNGGNVTALPSGTGTGGAIMVASGQGQAGGLSLAVTAGSGFGGPGAPSIFGGGTGFISAETGGSVAMTRGSGGSGTCNNNSNGALGGGGGLGAQVIFTPFA